MFESGTGIGDGITDGKAFEQLLSGFCAATGSAGYLGLMVDMDGRPWIVVAALQEEEGLQTVTEVSEIVMDYVKDHWPTDDQVAIDHMSTPEEALKGIRSKKAKRAFNDFNDSNIKN